MGIWDYGLWHDSRYWEGRGGDPEAGGTCERPNGPPVLAEPRIENSCRTNAGRTRGITIQVDDDLVPRDLASENIANA